ncbi:MAG TPA: hypothetical protein VHL79_21230 [Ramlibacter sp.]|nr:hypothetical protein [Ramlibacter sp.]
MSQGDKSAHTEKQKHQSGSIEKGHEQKGVTRPAAEARPRAPVNNRPNGAGKKMGAGRKVPFGPVGGLGRKTNLSRSS